MNAHVYGQSMYVTESFATKAAAVITLAGTRPCTIP